jgi:phosphoribosylglycinamide formyltransferase-1
LSGAARPDKEARPAIVVLVSGEGTNLQALIDAAASGSLPAGVAAVISDRSTARGLERAREAGIRARHIGPEAYTDRDTYEHALADAIEAEQPAAVILAGFMRVLHAELLGRFAGRILNIHPSLLPKYRGLNTHRRALAAGEAQHGATVHFVTEELDAGPAIIQYRMPVHAGDTPESLAARVHRGEHIILPRAVTWLVTGRLSLATGSVMLDGICREVPVIVEADE